MTVRKKGDFQPGQSGNPKGRPRGASKNSALRKELADCLPGILQMLVQAAGAGDVAAIRLILERTIPALRPTDSPVTIPMAGTLAEQGQAVLAAIGRGEITPAVGAQVVGALAAQARIVEAVDLDERLTRLEERTNDSNQ